MKKFLKWLLISIIGFIVILALYILIKSKPLPTGQNPAKADLLATEMLQALNKEAWDSLKLLQWNFADRHQYLYNKEKNMAIIKWDDVEVLLDLENVDGDVTKGGEMVQNEDKKTYLDKAWSYWCNDSFWMFAPYKVLDPGTIRTIAKDDEGQEGLMVTYNGGGVTPGDSYLWFLDKNKIPTGYKMWVQIIPIGGLYASWDQWITLPSGAKVSTFHDIGFLKTPMKDVKEGNSYTDFGYSSDPFVLLN